MNTHGYEYIWLSPLLLSDLKAHSHLVHTHSTDNFSIVHFTQNTKYGLNVILSHGSLLSPSPTPNTHIVNFALLVFFL